METPKEVRKAEIVTDCPECNEVLEVVEITPGQKLEQRTVKCQGWCEKEYTLPAIWSKPLTTT